MVKVLMNRIGALFLIIVIPVGIFFTIIVYPIWLAPPYIEETLLVHVFLTLLWTIGYVAWSFSSSLLKAVIFVLSLLIVLTLLCCSYSSLVIQFFPDTSTNFGCEILDISDKRVEYKCTKHEWEKRTVYILEGYKGLPFVHVKEKDDLPQ